jgi:hypothetical protein
MVHNLFLACRMSPAGGVTESARVALTAASSTLTPTLLA